MQRSVVNLNQRSTIGYPARLVSLTYRGTFLLTPIDVLPLPESTPRHWDDGSSVETSHVPLAKELRVITGATHIWEAAPDFIKGRRVVSVGPTMRRAL